jgi:hypothetical protein
METGDWSPPRKLKLTLLSALFQNVLEVWDMISKGKSRTSRNMEEVGIQETKEELKDTGSQEVEKRDGRGRRELSSPRF